MQRLCIIFLCVSLIKAVLSAELPANIEKCHFDDEKCLIKSANDFIRKYPKGLAEIGLVALDEIKVADIVLINSPGPLYIYYQLKDQIVKGFENSTITEIKGFAQDPTLKRLEVSLKVPRLVEDGIYVFQGRGLIANSNTTGVSQSELLGVVMNVNLKVFVEYRNNKRYLKVYDVNPNLTLERWVLNIKDNLYKENTDLSVVLNRVVNENWLEFWNEIESQVKPIFASGISEALNKVLENVAYDDMFLPPNK